MAKAHIIKFAVDTAGRMRDSIPTILKYAKAELGPPKVSELKEVAPAIKHVLCQFKSGGYKNLTVKEAWLNTLVAAEIAGWFFVGEIIGRRQLVGYPLKL
ncbi:ATP synthase subunit g, mitochondrial-like [Planococcus citri]|uniref:ATP synthase subunit g, mitochondrial-like n=1 Tax=Planococcus citri TaxID=170843 RepID=UPI0031F88F7E